MENNKKNVLNDQPNNEEKKNNKLLAWWLGLGKWAKVGVCAGSAAVLATAITLPIVLTQNKGGKTPEKPFTGEVTSAEFKTALSSAISIKEEDVNFVCTITNNEETDSDATFNVKNKKDVIACKAHGEDVIYSEFFSLYLYSTSNQPASTGHDIVLENEDYFPNYYLYFNVFKDNTNEFSKFKFDNINKEYKLAVTSNPDVANLTAIKFNDKKKIETATVTHNTNIATYNFTYDNANIDNFIQPRDDNFPNMTYKSASEVASSEHYVYAGTRNSYVEIDVSKLTTFGAGKKLECKYSFKSGDRNSLSLNIYIDGAFQYASIDQDNVISFNQSAIKIDSKIAIYESSESSATITLTTKIIDA